jgi:hypothetical protein
MVEFLMPPELLAERLAVFPPLFDEESVFLLEDFFAAEERLPAGFEFAIFFCFKSINVLLS